MRTRFSRRLITVALVLPMLTVGVGSLCAQPAPEGAAVSEARAPVPAPELFAGLKTRMFRNLPFYDALRAEHHAALNKLLIPAWSEEFPHSENAGSRFAWQVHLMRPDLIAEEELPGASVDSDDELREFVRNRAWGHHASCTCAIGPERTGGVLTGDFKVHGTSGLRVVDASVFPRIPGLFIVSAVYMIAEKAADVIAADARRA